MGDAVTASSNLNETLNKTSVVFGDSAGELVKWSETSATALGLSQQAALDAAGGFGALFTSLGTGRGEAVQMSETLVQLASDAASFYNLDPSETLGKIKSGLAGQSEPLRAIGVFLTEAGVAAKAVQLGLAQSTDSVSEAAKVTARYNLILEQSKIVQGDFGNTSKGLANAQRVLTAELSDGSARLGNTFRPAIEAITNSLVDLAPQMFTYAQNITDQFANGLAAGIRAILPVIQTIRQLFTYWFKPGSPPRILPDLTKWGRGAMRAYLDGFQAADVKSALGSLGKTVETILRGFVKTGSLSDSDLISRVVGSRDAITKAVSELNASVRCHHRRWPTLSAMQGQRVPALAAWCAPISI